MPNVNGTSIELQIGASDTKVAKSVSCAITTASDLPDASTKDSSGFLENIYGLRNATIDADFLSTYDESITFETFATYQITREQIAFKYTSDTIEISGNCKVESVEEVADAESVSRYSVVLSVDGVLVQSSVIEDGNFLLLETGDFLLLETDDKLILE
mgnify:CR=1 FL=1